MNLCRQTIWYVDSEKHLCTFFVTLLHWAVEIGKSSHLNFSAEFCWCLRNGVLPLMVPECNSMFTKISSVCKSLKGIVLILHVAILSSTRVFTQKSGELQQSYTPNLYSCYSDHNLTLEEIIFSPIYGTIYCHLCFYSHLS